MKNNFSFKQLLLFFAFVFLGASANLKAQTVISVGATSTYKTIQTAYDAIKNDAVLTPITGAYVLELQTDYDPTAVATLETFPITLNAINGASATNTITIRPETGAKITLAYPNQTVIESSFVCNSTTSITVSDVDLSKLPAIASTTPPYITGSKSSTAYSGGTFKKVTNITGNTLTLEAAAFNSVSSTGTVFLGPSQTQTINLNGAKWVIIDGTSRTDATTGLTIANPNCIYAQTIYFTGGANNNTIKNCIIRGANQTNAYGAGTGGTIYFNTADNNTLTLNDVCDMDDGITPMPTGAFQVTGVGNNTYNTISENNIYNIENSIASAVVNAGFINFGSPYNANSHHNYVLNNKMYWTRTANFYTGTNVVGVGVGGSMGGLGNRFEGNTIGYANANGTGTSVLNGSGVVFKAVNNFRNFTCINNTVSNIDVTGASFTGIDFGASDTSTPDADVVCNGNTVQNIKLTLSTAGTLSGITVNAANPYDSNIKTNIVRNLTAESATPTFACTVVGINVTGTANTKIYNYTGNQVYNLTAGKSTSIAANVATGLSIGGNAITVEKNIIYNIAALNATPISPTTLPVVTGIQTAGGNTTGTVVKNNIVRLGTDFSTDATIYGINQGTVSLATNKVYFYNNSIFVGGSSPATAYQNSFAFYTATATIPTNNDIENNIFDNQRTSSSGIAKHYALGYGTAGAIKLSDYNLYFATPLGLAVSADKTTLTDFAYTASDAHSLTGTPGFNNPTATTPDLTCNPTISTVDGVGLNLAATTPAVTDDYIGTSRGTSNDIGAYNYTSSGPSPVTASISSSGSPTTDNPISLTIQFNASVTGFDITDLVVRNGVASNFSGSGTTYTVNIIPTGAAISVDVPAGAAVDGSGNANSQASQWSVAYNSVTVTATLGTTSANYPTVKAAFDAINAGTHKGAINIALYTSTTESASAVLNASGSGSASYTSVNIYPMASNLVIAGNLAAPLIDLNGADNVILNGSVNQANNAKSLSIINYSNSATAGTSTIRLYNDAKSNTIKYCIIKGSTMDATGGVVFVSTGPTDGNDNNIITYNDITNAADVNRPLAAINSTGGVTPINDNLEISNNNIFDFFNRGTASYGVYLGANTSAARIKDNSFYETTTFIPTAASAYNVIYITNTSGVNFDVSNNNIGGHAAMCGGNAWTKTNAYNNLFSGIYLNVGTSTVSSIQNNTIKKFDYSNNGTQTWSGITVVAGNVNIGTVTQNTIGASTGNTSILYTSSGTGVFYGINSTSAGTVTCKNNLIGGITSTTSAGTTYGIYHNVAASTLDCQFNTITSILTVGNTAATSSQFKGVYIGNAATATVSSNTISNINVSSASTGTSQSVIGIQAQTATTLTISSNTVYNITNSINNSTTAGSNLYGIHSGAAATQSITGNTIHDLTVGLTKSTDNSIYGIGVNSTSATGSTVTGNTIYGISSNNSSFAGPVTGIYYNGKSSGTNSVARNFIYGLSVDASTTATSLYGIKIVAGTTTYANNMINLGGNTQSTLYGIYETGAASNNNSLYHNSVYIGGTPSATANSYALYSAGVANARDFRNNILVNARKTNGVHYAAYIAAKTTGTLNNNYNLYFTSGIGGMLGNYSGDKSVLPIVTGATGNDANSNNSDPVFVNPTASIPDMKIISAISYANANGVSVAAVTDDYYGNLRSDLSATDIGAYAYDPARPTLDVTTTATSIGTTTATSGGNITLDGGSSIAARGVCWATTANPTTANNPTSNGSGTGSFTSSITGLTANTVYNVRSYATNATLTGYGANVSFTTLPAAPTSSNATGKTSTGFTAPWTAPTQGAAAFTYTLEYSTVSDLSSGVIAISSIASGTTSYAITGLNSNTTYYFRVKAVNSTGTSAASTIKISTTLPATTTSSAATNISATGFIANWVAPSQGSAAFTYTLEYGTASDLTGATITNGILSSNLSSAISGLTANTTYYYRVSAVNGAGSGASSAIQSVTTLPAAPTVSAASAISATGFTANWTAPTQGATTFTYTLEYSTVADLTSGVTTVNNIASTNLSSAISSLTASTTYYYRVTAVNSAAGAPSAIQSVTTAGPTVVDTPKNVSDLTIVPGSIISVTNGGFLTLDQPTAVSSINVAAGGKLTLASGNTLSTGAITLQNTATYVDENPYSLVTPPVITANVKQTLTSGRNWYVSSPITTSTASASQLSTATSVVCYNEATGLWDTQTGALTAGKGYISVTTKTDGDIAFNGTLNTGDVPVLLTRSGTNATKPGFNLLGNPYPSYLNVMTAINANANMEKTVWYRTRATSGTYYFETVNTTSGVGTNVSATGTVTGYIPPMQAFWVRATASTSLTFTNAMRSHATNVTTDGGPVPTTLLKAPSARKSVQEVLRLQVSNGANSDEAIILFNPNASNAFDDYDSPKMSNGNVAIPEIYTTVGNEQLVINGLNSVPLDQEIPLGFKTGTANTFSIKATELRNFAADLKIVLKDKVDHTEQELALDVPYSFNSGVVNDASRFSLIFKSAGVTTGVHSADYNAAIQVYKNANNQIVINCPVVVVGRATVSVYNAVGQKLETTLLNATTTVLPGHFTSGVYFVAVLVNGNVDTRKVIIN